MLVGAALIRGASLRGDSLGADGDRTMMLVYNLLRTDAIYQQFNGIAGAAYFVAGLGHLRPAMKSWSLCQSVPGSGYGPDITSTILNLRRLKPGTHLTAALKLLEAEPSSLISRCFRPAYRAHITTKASMQWLNLPAQLVSDHRHRPSSY
jgi:hypothetical protein